ncbi:hypothetical protein DPMN_039341 [Dreissena polymorpha]|uniref:Uncharacterized protein n=1 Tax=Dreissena polymorpha TaxID=45954 RepID=A0A9D4RP25_DREPO|nr:hypothetical protein DPMN_039341 [Dreissena polymorpha]
MRREVLKFSHDIRASGHLGIIRSLQGFSRPFIGPAYPEMWRHTSMAVRLVHGEKNHAEQTRHLWRSQEVGFQCSESRSTS